MTVPTSRTTTRRTSRAAAVVPAVVLAVVLSGGLASGCGAGTVERADRGESPRTSTATSESRVVRPDGPGDPATVLEPGEAFEVSDGGYSELDIRFVEQMIPHHRQAVEMAALAPDRAAADDVHAVAERVTAAQQPEIAAYEAWLEGHGLPVPDAEANGGHDHGADMPGMITPFQLQALEDASGEAFDRLFLTYMIAHHEGAVVMAAPVVVDGLDARALEMAADVTATQQVEITRMRDLLDDL